MQSNDLNKLRVNGIIKLKIGADNFFMLNGEYYLTNFNDQKDLIINENTSFKLDTLNIKRSYCKGNPNIIVQFNSPNNELNDVLIWEEKESNMLTKENQRDFDSLERDVKFQDKEFLIETSFEAYEKISDGNQYLIHEKLFSREVSKDLFEYILIRINKTKNLLNVWTGVVIDKNEIEII